MKCIHKATPNANSLISIGKRKKGKEHFCILLGTFSSQKYKQSTHLI